MDKPKITDGTLYKYIRKGLPIKVTAIDSKDAAKAEYLQMLVNHSNELHHMALKTIQAKGK